MTNQEIIDIGQKYIMNTYGRYPIALVRGEGCHVWDADGKEYIDFLAGIAVNSLGHCHPAVVNAIKNQAENLIHCSNYYWNEPAVNLAKILVENSCCDKVFFCNSGAEANEGAIKLARKYAKMKGYNERYSIITMQKSFHGRTLATLTATGQQKVQVNFDPLPPGFQYVPYNDIDALKEAINETTCAVMLEPVQGEGGVLPANAEYMKAVRSICDEHDLLMICDEVQSGIGRTGKLFAYQHSDVEPDVVTLAKALGGGAAIGAFMVKDDKAALVPGDHGSTFGGNPLATAAGYAALSTIIEQNLVERAALLGEYMAQKLEILKKDINYIEDVRGKGLLLGLKLSVDGAPIVKECMERGVLINCTAGTVLRFVPPLNITTDDIDRVVDVLHDVMKEFNK